MSNLQETFEGLFPGVPVTAREFLSDTSKIEQVVVSSAKGRVVVTLGREDFTFQQLVFDVKDGDVVLTAEGTIDFFKEVLGG